MKWAHLPVSGGLYDQDPEFIRKVTIIFRERAAHDERERKKEESKNRSAGRRGGSRRRS